MQDGFFTVAVATPTVSVGDCVKNMEQILLLIDQAHQKEASLLVLPELCVTGYTCLDLWLQTALQHAAIESLARIGKHTKGKEMLVAVGAPLVHEQKLYNCAVIFYDGAIIGVVPKTHIPNYMEFQELRYFAPALPYNTTIAIGEQMCPFGSKLLFCAKEHPAFVCAFEICEDLWVMNPPSTQHAMAGATVIGNLSASNETIGKDAYRRSLVQGQSSRLLCGYLYASAGEGESTTDLVFSGHNMVAESGQMLVESVLFSNDMLFTQIDLQKLTQERLRRNTATIAEDGSYQRVYFEFKPKETTLTRSIWMHPFVPAQTEERSSRCKQILLMQAMGLKKRLQHTGSKTVLIGLSGGLDSTLALLCAVHTMRLLDRPVSDVVAVTMPCFGTTNRTKENAKKLADELGITFLEIPIATSVLAHFKDIGHDPQNHDVIFENAQARERTQVLMDLANQRQGLVIGTGDLSELALGFATYNGDHMAMYSVNASIPKTLVRHLVAHEAIHSENVTVQVVLNDILDTPVSPELLPDDEGRMTQKTEEIIGPYELHDFFLYYMLRFGYAPRKIFRLTQHAFGSAYDENTIHHWLTLFYRRFFAGQFKRSCMPDGVKIGSVGLSPRGDLRLPSDAVGTVWLKELEALK